METEELFCESCKKVWNRQKTRGRKPRVCPDCVPQLVVQQDVLQEDDDDILSDIPVIDEPPLAPTKYPANTKWRCPSCGASVKIGIGINDPPTHKCPKRLKRVYPLEMV